LFGLLLTSCGPHEERTGVQGEQAVNFDPYHIPEGSNPKIDKFFVINLDKSINKKNGERLDLMRADFAKHGLEFERFAAVYGKRLSTEERKKVYHYDPRYLKRGLADGEIGNYLSHFGVLKKIVENGYHTAVVLEDDVTLHADRFKDRLDSVVAHAPANWDVIYLGCHATEESPKGDKVGYGEKTGEVVDCRPSRMQLVAGGRLVKLDTKCLAGNYGYVVSARGAEKLTKNMLPMSMPTDYAWKDLFVAGTFGEFNAYCSNPELVTANYALENTININGKHRAETPAPKGAQESPLKAATKEIPSYRNFFAEQLNAKGELKIPKIVHHVWHTWKPQNPNPPAQQLQWMENLKKLHPDWTFKTWREADCEALLAAHYPEYLKLYQSYDKPVKRVDMIKYFILHHEGGLMINQGFMPLKNLEPLLWDADLVFAEQYDLEFYSVNNAFMAAAPRHGFFELVFGSLEKRKDLHILKAAGPALLTDSLNEYAKMGKGEFTRVLHKKFVYPFSWHDEIKNAPEAKQCFAYPQSCSTHYPDAFLIYSWPGTWFDQV